MAERDLAAIARDWWADDGTGDAFTAVWTIQMDEHPMIPATVRALVDAVPPDQSIAHVGTSVLETLMMEPDALPAERVVGFLRDAALTLDEITEILTGMYPEFREPLERLL